MLHSEDAEISKQHPNGFGRFCMLPIVLHFQEETQFHHNVCNAGGWKSFCSCHSLLVVSTVTQMVMLWCHWSDFACGCAISTE